MHSVQTISRKDSNDKIMAINERRTEWSDPYGNGSVGYSRPVTEEEHNANVTRFVGLGKWKPSAYRKIEDLVRPLPPSGQYFYASLVLEGNTEGQIRVALKKAGF